MARNEQLIRQHKLLQLLETARYGKSLDQLTRELVDVLGLAGLSGRTVRRDLEALQAAGFDVDTHTTPRGAVWKLGPALRGLPKLSATCTELLALSMGRDLLAPLAGTPYAQGIDSLWHKLRELLPASVWRHFERRRPLLMVRGLPVKSYAPKRGILDTLNRCILQRRVVRIEYQSLGADAATVRSVQPYGVAAYQGSLYLLAVPHGDGQASAGQAGEVRHYKLDRFRKATATDERFKPRKVNLQTQFAHSLGVYRAGTAVEFRIRLSAKVTPWAEETPWHPEQKLQKTPDGGCVLTIPAAYESEVLPRVLGLGADAEILAPASARARLAETAAAMVKLYDAGADA